MIGYENTIFNQEFHMKYNGAVLKITEPSRPLVKYGLSSKKDSIYFVYFIDYRNREIYMKLIHPKIIYSVYEQNEWPLQEDYDQIEGFCLSLNILKGEEKHIEIIGHIKDYKIWPSFILLSAARSKTRTENLSHALDSLNKIAKEIKYLSEVQKKKILLPLVEELKFYRAL